jgi:hypothetical protein
MATASQVEAFLRSYLDRRSDVGALGLSYRPGPLAWYGPRPTVEELAADVAAQAEFDALKLADLVNSPDGSLIAAGVGLVIPEVYAADYALFVDALKLAAKTQQKGRRQFAGALALVAVLLFALAIFSE